MQLIFYRIVNLTKIYQLSERLFFLVHNEKDEFVVEFYLSLVLTITNLSDMLRFRYR